MMTEFDPEEFLDIPEGGRIDALSDAFLAAGADGDALSEEIDYEPIEPMDV